MRRISPAERPPSASSQFDYNGYYNQAVVGQAGLRVILPTDECGVIFCSKAEVRAYSRIVLLFKSLAE
jgi:hypothetical protein